MPRYKAIIGRSSRLDCLPEDRDQDCLLVLNQITKGGVPVPPHVA